MKKRSDRSKNILTILGRDLTIVITITDISFDLLVRRVILNSLINLATVVKPPVNGISDMTIIKKSKIFQPSLK
jgi:hypothetical protein